MSEINYIVLISRWLHIAAVLVAVGAAVFMRFALMPSVKATLDDETHDRLREAIRRRWMPFVHGSIAVLLLTGMTNFYFLALAPKVKPMPYHLLFGVKFMGAMFVFFVAMALVSRSPGFESIRTSRGRWLSALLVTATGLILLSGILSQVRG